MPLTNPPDPDNPFTAFTPDATKVARQQAARLRSGAQVWGRATTGAAVCGLAAAVVLVLVLCGPNGMLTALTRILIGAGTAVALTLVCMVFVAHFALRYWRVVGIFEPAVSRRPVLALLGAAAALGAVGGAVWFAAELPDRDGWLLVGGILVAMVLGGVVGVRTARSTPSGDDRVRPG
jgi:hypothetical protein